MKNRKFWFYIVALTVMVVFITCYSSNLYDLARINHFMNYETAKEKLRAQEIPKDLYETFQKWGKNGDFSSYEFMCAYYITGETRKNSLENMIPKLKELNKEVFSEFTNYLTAVWDDLEVFPVPDSVYQEEEEVSYVNSWMFERTYGGTRGHEGTDLMAVINQRGIYPIISMTDGVVENIGWLPKGGYRIGIRSPHGGYFYYAHLYDYAKDFQQGEAVKAGDLLGFMGDSGYSEIEGTVGNFDVHLHVGIYVNQPDGSEMSINPYWTLLYLEENKISYNDSYKKGFND